MSSLLSLLRTFTLHKKIIRNKFLFSVLLTVALVIAILGSNGSVSVISTNQVKGPIGRVYQWEPHSATGPTSTTWATSWTEYSSIPGTPATASYVSTWNGSWGAPTLITAPAGIHTQDLYLAWDSFNSRSVLACLSFQNEEIWVLCSNCGSGGGWGILSKALAESPSVYNWDYPSIGVDASGRIIVGATKINIATGKVDGFWTTRRQADGSWTSPARVSPDPGYPDTWHSRVVATNNKFVAFIQHHDPDFNPTGIDWYESTDGQSWTHISNLSGFASALNRSPGKYSSTCTPPTAPCNCTPGTCPGQSLTDCRKIGYSPSLEAKGFTNGNWAVIIPINVYGYSNIYICTSDRGCGIVNQQQDDQFLAATAVSSEASGGTGYWVSYLTYSTLTTRNLPLIVQSIYFPPGGAAIGATTYNNVDPKSWPQVCPDNICGVDSCFAMGDYTGIAAKQVFDQTNPYPSSSTPFVLPIPPAPTPTPGTVLYQTFAKDPPQQPNVPNFRPNFIPYPMGADLKSLGIPLTPDTRMIPPIRNGVRLK